MGDWKRRLIIYAGPNGSGKSKITEKTYENSEDLPSLYINADKIAKDESMSSLAAAVEADRRRNEAIEAGDSFVTETVMSTPAKLELMRRAKERGYYIRLEYVTTQSPLINVGRVRARVKTGGHDVPEEKIVSRYERSMGQLPEAARIADDAIIYDNSSTESARIAEKSSDGRWRIYPQTSPGYWNRQRIKALLACDDAELVTGAEDG